MALWTRILLLILFLPVGAGCFGSKEPKARVDQLPTCSPTAFFDSKKYKALIGYRCRDEYAVAVTANYAGRLTFEVLSIYVAHGTEWVRAVQVNDDIRIPFSRIQAAKLNPMLIASRLNIPIDTDGEQSLDLESLDCNGKPVSNGACVIRPSD
jgi:hypothetical protein